MQQSLEEVSHLQNKRTWKKFSYKEPEMTRMWFNQNDAEGVPGFGFMCALWKSNGII